jgi:hypothetical protein
MIKSIILTMQGLLLTILSSAQYINYSNTDPRLASNGSEIPSRTYADQPYVIVCDDGSWLCAMTTSSGTEGAHMNNIISTKSYDQGKTWTDPVNVEPPGVPQSSWAVPLKVPGGRIYVFYNYNKYHFTGLEGVMSGPFMFKYSDDNGKTWSEKRYEAPIRITKIDRDNYTSGKYQFFWSIDKPVVTENAAYITFSKVLRTSPDQKEFYARSEGFILKSENILRVKDPEKIKWETLPDGETGILNPDFGKVQAEHNMVILNNGNFYVAYRTWDGSPAYAISSDGGKTFSTPKYMRYANGERMGNPRACPKIYKTEDGKYLFWFHNNFRQKTYDGRNPAWLSGGIERNGDIVWSQPEIAIYTTDPAIRGMSYPDYVEQGGRLWIIETQKNEARVHQIDPNLVQGMWDQGKDTIAIRNGLIMDSDARMLEQNQINFPQLPNLIKGGGFSIGLWLTINDVTPGQRIFSTIGAQHKGIEISLADNNAIEIHINDGEVREDDISKNSTFVSDQNSITAGKLHHVVFIIDGAAKIATILVDGVLSDGSVQTRNYGWGRVYPYLSDLNDTDICKFDDGFKGNVHHMRVYDRALRTSEAIANFNAGLKQR